MFERFTDRARRTVTLAQEEARLLNSQAIGTEHLLLGLVHEGEGVAAKALIGLGIDLEEARARVEEMVGDSAEHTSPAGHIPFTPRAKKVIELSLREALQLGHNYIGTEHILLGLIREGEGIGAKVLVVLGADLSRVRQEIIRLLSGYAGMAPKEPAQQLQSVPVAESADDQIELATTMVQGQMSALIPNAAERVIQTLLRLGWTPPVATKAAESA